MIRLISNTRFAILKETSVVAYVFVSSTEFRCFQVNTSSVDVSWNPVPEEGFRGLPMGYQVSLYALSDDVIAVAGFIYKRIQAYSFIS